MDKSTAYNLLGLAQSATEDDVKTAYLSRAKTYAPENYEAGPLQEEAARKMDELNDAFDTVMSFLRTGSTEVASREDAPPRHTHAAPQEPHVPPQPQQAAGPYAAIRQLIAAGRADEALAQLRGIAGGETDAEWNFLMGSAYYYKGWLNDALRYFEAACRLAPDNREYRAALNNLTSRQQGEMPGNPYVNQGDSSTAMDCACHPCTMLCCMDFCCGSRRGC